MEILGLICVPNWLLVIIGLFTAYYLYMTRHYGVFKKMGINGPKPALVMGNLRTIMSKGLMDTTINWYNEYGKVFGTFEGPYPVLFVADEDMLRDILVKEFSSFTNRKVFDGISEYPLDHALSMLKDDHWKHVRNTLTPTFSSGKLKKMFVLIDKCANILVENFKENSEKGENIEVKELTGAFTMDVICSTAFGIEIDSQKIPDNQFVKAAKGFFNPSVSAISFIMLFPFLARFLPVIGIRVFPKHLLQFFIDVTSKAMKQRSDDKQKYNDFLQLMMDAQVEDGQEVDKEIDHSDLLKISSTWTRKGLTEGDIQGQALTFFLAGYETTASALAFTLYELAINPDVCGKAQQEVDDVLGDGEPDYEKVNSLQYVGMCIDETLRLFPPAVRFERTCNNDIDIRGIKISKGMFISVPAGAIHKDPAIWPDPDKFDPERFTAEAKAERSPFSYMPFGQGPRNCIGMRLALIEAKLAIAKILRQLTPVRCDKTEVPIKLRPFGITAAKNGIWIKMVQRE